MLKSGLNNRARYILDNILVGLTPIAGIQTAGDRSHQLQVRKAGYEIWSRTLIPGEKAPVMIQLRKVVPPPPPPKQNFWQRLFKQ